MTAPTPDPRQLEALQLIWDIFVRDNRWPSFAAVDHEVYERGDDDLRTILDPVRPALVTYDPHDYAPGDVALTLAGIDACDGSDSDLSNVLAALRWCVAAERKHDPTVSPAPGLDVTKPEMSRGLALSGDELDRVFAVFASEGFSSGHSIPSDEADPWSLHIDRRIRLYKNVTSVPELLAATERTQPPAQGVQIETVPDAQNADDDQNDPKVFVLMPFGPDWSRHVYDAIKLGCSRVGAPDVQRADAITKPGLITTQILTAIAEADVIVADLTEANGNVMYEVGYADGLGKSVVLLNQQIDNTLFDVRGHRQIAYVLHDLSQLAEDVAVFVTTVLSERVATGGSGLAMARDRVEALRDAYRRGQTLRDSLPWHEGVPTTAAEAVEADKRAQELAIQWAQQAWTVLRADFPGHEREFHGPGTGGLGSVGFWLSALEEMDGQRADTYLESKLRLLEELLRRVDH